MSAVCMGGCQGYAICCMSCMSNTVMGLRVTASMSNTLGKGKAGCKGKGGWSDGNSGRRVSGWVGRRVGRCRGWLAHGQGARRQGANARLGRTARHGKATACTAIRQRTNGGGAMGGGKWVQMATTAGGVGYVGGGSSYKVTRSRVTGQWVHVRAMLGQRGNKLISWVMG